MVSKLVQVALIIAVLVVTSTALAKPKRRLNMPKRWTWPPSKTMKRAGRRCLKRLTKLGVRWQRAPRTRKVATPIRVRSMSFNGVDIKPIWRKPPFTMDCYLALAFAETATMLRRLGVRTLRFSTIHRYRSIRRGGVKRRRILSRHAIGLAIDVYEIVDAKGKKHIVKRDYKRGDPLLLAVEREVIKSPFFRGLITPRKDPRSHHDHYHFEAAMPLR